jgi:cytochrome c peroxidase
MVGQTFLSVPEYHCMSLQLSLLARIGVAGCACLIALGPPTVPADKLPDKLAIDRIPLGLDANRRVPEDNPLTESGVQLGRMLFFDPVLSRNGKLACASCHDPSHGFAGREPVAVGVDGKKGRRHAPSLLNRAYAQYLFWDGREDSLEAQVLKPIEDPLELGNTIKEVLRRLNEHGQYPARFKAAFSDGITAENLGKALASFQRTLLLGDSRVDRFRAGNTAALSEQERHGMWLWESKGRCWQCHSGPTFTDGQFHNTGVSWGKEPVDFGRWAVTGKEEDRGRFKTPSLRGVASTAPYMHDGSIATLEEVVQFYDRGGGANPNRDVILQPLWLSKQEVKSLVAFLRALSEGEGPAGVFRLESENPAKSPFPH